MEVDNESDFQDLTDKNGPEIVMDSKLLNAYATAEEIVFEVTCSVCWEDSGPPATSCVEGHTTCASCFGEGMKTCKALVRGETKDTSELCGEKLFGIDDPIQNTEYYKFFMEITRYSCALKPFGCDAVLSGQEIMKHETEECAYRLFKHCQFHFYGCAMVFQNLASNLKHLIDEHKVPVQGSPEARLMVKYDRGEFLKTNGYAGVVPLIRGIMWKSSKDKMCLLMGEDLETGETRLWFVNPFPSNERKPLIAKVCVYSPTVTESNFDGALTVGNEEEIQLQVIPGIKHMTARMNSIDDGPKYYVDLKNNDLDKKYCVKLNGGKYFGLMVKVIEIKKKEPIVNSCAPGEAVQPEEGAICDNNDAVFALDNNELSQNFQDVLEDLRAKLAKMEEERERLEQDTPSDMETGGLDDDYVEFRKRKHLKHQIKKLKHKIEMHIEGIYIDDSDSSSDEDEA